MCKPAGTRQGTAAVTQPGRPKERRQTRLQMALQAMKCWTSSSRWSQIQTGITLTPWLLAGTGIKKCLNLGVNLLGFFIFTNCYHSFFYQDSGRGLQRGRHRQGSEASQRGSSLSPRHHRGRRIPPLISLLSRILRTSPGKHRDLTRYS